uniref:RNA-binding protein 48 n=1 Tax=Glossina brevipalpis TaxID=37001 RepID=A0A1A9WBA9_9MUSC
MNNTIATSSVEHHKRLEYCKTRLKYRQGRQLKAVKVYTIANESQYLLVFGVPKINLTQELKKKLNQFGSLEYSRNITEEWTQLIHCYELEPFTEVYRVKYKKIEDARKCKRFLDAREFYGGILHISYAPEYETTEELKHKLQKRANEGICTYQKNEVETSERKFELFIFTAPSERPACAVIDLYKILAKLATTPALKYNPRNCSLPKDITAGSQKLCNTYIFANKCKPE